MAVRPSRCESAAARMYASKGCTDSPQALPGRAETLLASEKNQSRLVGEDLFLFCVPRGGSVAGTNRPTPPPPAVST